MTDRQTRWQVALHEAGHVLVGLLFDPEAVRSAQLTPDGKRGVALVPNGLSDRQEAIVAAAGAAGERYAIRWSVLYIANIKPGNWRIPPIGAVIGCRVNGWHRLTPTNLILPVGLFATDTGFAGCMGSTGYMRASEGENLAVALFTPGPGEETVTLGKVWLRGMRSMAGKTPQERLLCFSLIGDPALRFGVPPYPGTAVSVR